jgi:sorting nexin-1/2
VEGVKETIRSAEAAKSDALREYESIKVICMETVCKIKMLHWEKMKGHELI